MSTPFADAPDRWGLVFHGDGRSRPAHTRPEWARIARAITVADNHLALSRNPTRRRGDAVWCQMALDVHTELRDAGAYDDLATGGAAYCYADRSAIRAWLDAPVTPISETPRIMLEAEGLDLAFPTDQRADPLALPLLVERAQDVGVFGIPDNHVQLWPCVGSRATQSYTYVLTVSPLAAAGLAGWPLHLGHVLNLDRPHADTIVAALTQVADIANHLLTNARADTAGLASTVDHAVAPGPDRLPTGVQGYPLGQGTRPFPPLSTRDTAHTPAPPVPPPSASDRGRRRA